MTVSQILKELIAIPSVSEQSNVPVVDWIVKFLEPHGWRLNRHSYHDDAGIEKQNLIALPANEEVRLALVSHTDTVPYPHDWAEAVNPSERNGIIYGRGACDVKGFTACILATAQTIDPKKDSVALVFTAEEEIGCIGAKHLMDEALLHPQYCVVGEPTGLTPIVAGKGYALAEITVTGVESHSAYPDRGKSAIVDAACLITQIEQLKTELATNRNGRFDPAQTTLNIGTIHGGTAKNIVAGECQFILEWRPIPNQDPNWVLHKVIALAEKFDGCKVAVKPLRQDPGFETPSESKLVKALETLSGNKAHTVAFGTEAPYFSALGAETVVFGAGDMLHAHRVDERVKVDELERCVKILRELIAEL
jgi:acetylornithine deacetylase